MFKHIMLATDGSEASGRAEKSCTALAKSIGAKVSAIHVVPHFHLHYQPWGAPREVHARIEEEHEQEALEGARKMMARVDESARASGVTCESMIIVGDRPYEEIIGNAEKRGCDLIMMGSRGVMGMNALLLGSEAVKVLTHAKIPVLVVH